MSEKIFERLTDAAGVYFEGTLAQRRRTPFQLLEVYETPELGRIFRLDGSNMTSERDEFFYHENLVHPAAVAHPGPRRALVIGGGDGGSSEELLKHRTLEQVHMAELGRVVDLEELERRLAPLDELPLEVDAARVVQAFEDFRQGCSERPAGRSRATRRAS